MAEDGGKELGREGRGKETSHVTHWRGQQKEEEERGGTTLRKEGREKEREMGGRTLGERNKEEYEEARGRGRRTVMVEDEQDKALHLPWP